MTQTPLSNDVASVKQFETVFYLKPRDVKIDVDLPRFRKDMGDVTSLARSIAEKGQLQPCIVDADHRLIAGGRRLAACILLDREVMCILLNETSQRKKRELELIENLERKQFTPAEEAQAIAEIHRLKQEEFGTTKQGAGVKDGWALGDTANLVGKSRASVSNALSIADAINAFPELKSCKTQAQIMNTAKTLAKSVQKLDALEEYAENIKQKIKLFALYNEDATKHMAKVQDNTIDLLLTDPPFGIDIGDVARGIGGVVGGGTLAGEYYEDSKDYAMHCYSVLAKHSIRFTKPTSSAYIFVAPEHFNTIREMFSEVGWLCHVRPIIWVKSQTGQTNHPKLWPGSCYEMILFARREGAELFKEGAPDIINIPKLPPSQKDYPSEKPVPLMQELIQRSAHPNMLMYDPFMGSGASVEAAHLEKLRSVGVDKSINAYAVAVKRMAKYCTDAVAGLDDVEAGIE